MADFGIGVKAGTLGLGIEGRWEPPVPWFDFRIGANQYEYAHEITLSGIDYDSTLMLDNYYLTGNLKFPASPLRLTVGAYSNGNEVELFSRVPSGFELNIGGTTVPVAESGALRGTATFDKTAPYFGVGFDFEILGKAGVNFDFGVLWQSEPIVGLEATSWDDLPPIVQDFAGPAIEAERAELEDDLSAFKAWPVVSLSFVYNF
ncbi:MAG: hypothetical protein HKO69_04470 [Woeseiaceae bacterium]|nr:hypothetical protein [Gammaproteobacteria bacterium]NNF48972.1 hypothetical protein [Woeseiaceae bacterium]NNK24939.1 hypothetical protein [Woeseiaceae bacterium]NNL63050.1 hypothetical protein [Woeseiaceae bacterium]